MNKEQEIKLHKAIDKMMSHGVDTVGKQLTQRLQQDGIYGWQVSYQECKDYFVKGSMQLKALIVATELTTNKVEGESFGATIDADILMFDDSFEKLYRQALDSAYLRLKAKIIKCQKFNAAIDTMLLSEYPISE